MNKNNKYYPRIRIDDIISKDHIVLIKATSLRNDSRTRTTILEEFRLRCAWKVESSSNQEVKSSERNGIRNNHHLYSRI